MKDVKKEFKARTKAFLDSFKYDPEVQEVNTHIDSNFVEYLATVHLDQIAMPEAFEWYNKNHMNHITTLPQNGYEHTRSLIVVYADPKYFRS